MKVRNIVIGEGMPKICVPLVSESLPELLSEASLARDSHADFAEWRADYFRAANHDDIIQALRALRIALGDMPLLFTFRTLNEGGKRQISCEEYLKLKKRAVCSGFVDLLDAELSSGDETCRELITSAHENSTAVVLSQHFFHKTPEGSEMFGMLEKMRDLGCDIAKLAVMPQSPDDVLLLLRVTSRFWGRYPDTPVITVSMGTLGKISRVSGGLTGSAITYAALKEASAPGQIAVDDLRVILETLHSA